MATNLFLDDERYPTQVTWITIPYGPWEIVRTSGQFCDYLLEHGVPQHISFDNDLGLMSQQEGRWCARWLAEQVMDGVLALPGDFTYTVHSMNPVAAQDIRQYLDQFLQKWPPQVV